MYFTILAQLRSCRAAVLLVAAACMSPSTASAACGDHVVVRDANGALPATTPDHGAPAPCHGPNCHSAPTHDPIAPVTPPTVTSPKDAVPLGDDDPPADAGPRFPRPTSNACHDGPAAGVFHPPRAG